MGEDVNSSITAIVLAGGQSSRMGRDKASIEIDGIPLLEQICTLAKTIADRVYVITPWPERYQNIVPKDCHLIREVPLAKQTTPGGPLLGFAGGLTRVTTEWVFLLACDLPCLNVSELERWTNYLEGVSPEAIALLPRHPKGWEPLCGFYRRRCLPLLNEFINQGGRSFQHWLAKYPVQELPVSDRQILFNCNTPEDLEQALKKSEVISQESEY